MRCQASSVNTSGGASSGPMMAGDHGERQLGLGLEALPHPQAAGRGFRPELVVDRATARCAPKRSRRIRSRRSSTYGANAAADQSSDACSTSLTMRTSRSAIDRPWPVIGSFQPGGVADQHDAVADRHVDPRVLVGVRRARADRRRRRQRLGRPACTRTGRRRRTPAARRDRRTAAAGRARSRGTAAPARRPAGRPGSGRRPRCRSPAGPRSKPSAPSTSTPEKQVVRRVRLASSNPSVRRTSELRPSAPTTSARRRLRAGRRRRVHVTVGCGSSDDRDVRRRPAGCRRRPSSRRRTAPGRRRGGAASSGRRSRAGAPARWASASDLVGIERRVERDVAADDVAARRWRASSSSPSRCDLGDAPRGDPLALRAVGELLGALEHEARPPGPLHHRGQRRSADAAADDRQVVGRPPSWRPSVREARRGHGYGAADGHGERTGRLADDRRRPLPTGAGRRQRRAGHDRRDERRVDPHAHRDRHPPPRRARRVGARHGARRPPSTPSTSGRRRRRPRIDLVVVASTTAEHRSPNVAGIVVARPSARRARR